MSIQIGKNIEGGEVTGFSLSRNTYAAVLVLLGMVTLGVAIQRIHDGDHVGWIIPLAVILALALLMLYRYVFSKTAYATPFIGAGMLTLVWFSRRWIASNGRRLYWMGIAVLVLGCAAVIGHGLKHGTLLQLSLTYRWQYWVGATRLFIHHPWLGVGWANFGEPYLAFRLPQAVEEIKDPHNFIVRAFAELGIVGGVLMIAWMLRMWWELAAGGGVRRTDAIVGGGGSVGASPSRSMSSLLIVPLIAMALSPAVSIE
jgi:O-antigen ligase